MKKYVITYCDFNHCIVFGLFFCGPYTHIFFDNGVRHSHLNVRGISLWNLNIPGYLVSIMLLVVVSLVILSIAMMIVKVKKSNSRKMKFGVKIDGVLHDLGFETVEIDGSKLYYNKNKGSYYRFTFIRTFRAYVIESASSYEEAKNNLFEDGNLFSIDMDEEEFVEKLRADLIKYYC